MSKRVWRCGICGSPCKGHGDYFCIRYYRAEPMLSHPMHRVCRTCNQLLQKLFKGDEVAPPCVDDLTEADKALMALSVTS